MTGFREGSESSLTPAGMPAEDIGKNANHPRITFLLWTIPLILAVVVGLFTINGKFVQDDNFAIVRNPVVVNKTISWSEPFQRGFWGRPIDGPITTYRPLMPVIWRMLWKIKPHSPFLFRLTTLLLHLMVTGMVLLVVYHLFGDRVIACIAASLFAVHPVHAEALGELVGQADILSTLLGLLALYIALACNRRITPLLVAALLVAACLAKESAVVFCAVIAVVALIPGGAQSRRRLDISICAGLVTLLTVLVQLSFKRITPIPLDNIAYVANGSEKILHGLYIIGRGMAMCFVPIGMSPYHDYAAIDLSLATLLPYAIPGALFLCIGIGALWISLKKRNAAGIIGLGLLFGPLVINSSLIVPIASELAERLLYPATIVTSTIMAYVICRAIGRHFRIVVVALLIVLFSVQSWSAQRPWRNDAYLYAYAVQVEPLSARLNLTVGINGLCSRHFDTAAWYLMVTTYIIRYFPNRVDPLPIMRLEGLPVGKRDVEGPLILAPKDTCGFLADYFQLLEDETPRFAPFVRKPLLKAYPACATSLSVQAPGNYQFRQKISLLPKVFH